MTKFLVTHLLLLAAIASFLPQAKAENLTLDEGLVAFEENAALEQEDEADEAVGAVSNPQAPSKYIFNMPVKSEFIWGGHFGPRIVGSLREADMLFSKRTRNPADVTPVAVRVKKSRRKKQFSYSSIATQFHIGTDFRIKRSTPVQAVYPGTVYAMGYMNCPGYTVAIKHNIPGDPQPIYTLYKHLEGILPKVIVGADGKKRIKKPREVLAAGEIEKTLRVGDQVEAGDEIALSGASGKRMRIRRGHKTGCVDGAHLHFEVRLPKSDVGNAVLAAVQESTRSTRKRLISKRLDLISEHTVAVNPADYIEQVDKACFEKKRIEIQNALLVEEKLPGHLAPISAGLCGENSEKKLKEEFQQFPKIYISVSDTVKPQT